MSKTSVFLSSPMPSGCHEWAGIRDNIEIHFESSGLNRIFCLERIESEGGGTPQELYLEQVARSDILLVLYIDEIKNGQKEEILAAIENRIPIIAIQIERTNRPISLEAKEFVEKVIYGYTKVDSVRQPRDIHDKITSTLASIVARRIRQAKTVKESIDLAIKPKDSVHLSFSTISSFCSYAVETNEVESALSLIEKQGIEEDQFFLLRSAVLLACGQEESEIDLERLDELSQTSIDASLIRISRLFECEDYNEINELITLYEGKDDFPHKELGVAFEFLSLYSMQCRAEDAAETWYAADKLSELTIYDIPIFRGLCESLYGLIRGANIDAGTFAPEVPCCLNCMPRENGDWVELSSSKGSVLELTFEKLETAYPGIPWYDFNIDVPEVTCSSCHSLLDSGDDVYRSITE